MSTVQSTYADTIGSGYVGGIVNTEPRTLISRTVEASAGLAFGLAVMQGTEDKEVVVGDGSAVLGVTVRDQSVTAEDPNIFEQYAEAQIMTKGVIWVENSGGVVAGDQVNALAAGALGTTTDAPIDGARWDTTADDGELAQLRLG